MSLQAEKFFSLLDGFEQVTPQDLLYAKKGGMLRYAIDTIEMRNGKPVVVSTRYLRGALLQTVPTNLQFLVLFNPFYANKNSSYRIGPKGVGVTWYVALQKENQRVRLWYRFKPETDEVQVFRKLLAKLESGDLQISSS